MYNSECSQPLSSAYLSLVHSSKVQRGKDPEKKVIQSRISNLVSNSIASLREKELHESILKNPFGRRDDDEFDDFELEKEFSPSFDSRLISEKNIPEDFLDEKKLGLKIEKVAEYQEFTMPDYGSGRETSAPNVSLSRRMFDLTAVLNDLKQEELNRLSHKYSNAPLTLEMLGDFQVLLSCLIGKGEAQKHVELWVHRRTGEAFNLAAEEKVARKKNNKQRHQERSELVDGFGLQKTEIEEKMDELKRMVKEFFIKLD